MRSIIAILFIAALTTAATLDLGIGVGTEMQVNNIQPIPMLTIGSTVGGLWSISAHAGAIGYSTGYEYHAAAGIGFGPVRMGVAVMTGREIVSYVGFEPVLNQHGRITCRALNIEGAPISTMGLTLTL
jgi:hypothetical protein